MTALAAARRTGLATVIVVLSLQSAWAFTGSHLWERCQDRSNGSNSNLVCAAYIRGFIDGFVSANTLAGMKVRICIPRSGISVTQARLIIEKYLRENPQRLHQEAGLLAMSAMIGAFSCDKSATK